MISKEKSTLFRKWKLLFSACLLALIGCSGSGGGSDSDVILPLDGAYEGSGSGGSIWFLIDGEGTLAYVGAIDDDPRGGKGDGATNYVAAALDEVLAGSAVTTAETKPYGCSVKYRR